VWRVDGQQWTTLHELLAMNAELMDQWGLFGARMRVKHPEKLPKESLRIPRPGAKSTQKDQVITDPREIARWFS
jgi:hypothetical protein